jgi:hypothetical protein
VRPLRRRTSGISGTGAEPKADRRLHPRPAIVFPGPGRDARAHGEAARVAEDLDAKLARLEARLAELQREVGPAGPPPSAPAQRPDALEQFGVELRRLAHELVAAYDRVLAQERAVPPASGRRVLLEADADLQALAALERALATAPGVRAVELRGYAAGRASLVVDVS